MKKTLPHRINPILHVLALCVALTAACSRTEPTAQQKDSFRILHLSDTHVCQLAGARPQLVEKRQRYDKGFESLYRVLTVLPEKVGAEAVAITGDMVDSWELESAEGNLRTNQVERFAAAASPVAVPLWLTLGNHDIRTHAVSQRIESRKGNPSTLQPHAEAARAAWTRWMQCFRDGTYYYKDVQVGGTSWRLYFLNDGYYLDDDPIGNLWDAAQLYWLENELDKTPEVVEFAQKLEQAALETVENGAMTGDLMLVATPDPKNRQVLTEEFIDEVATRLQKKLEQRSK